MMDHQWLTSNNRGYRQRGAIAPFFALSLGGILLATAFVLDSSRLLNNAGQIKRATDAAVMAVGNTYVKDPDTSRSELDEIAYNYVTNNLGMDSELAKAISAGSIVLEQEDGDDDEILFTVRVDLAARSDLLKASADDISIHSTAEVFSHPTEISLMLPNTLSEEGADIAALKRLGNRFAERLIQDGNQTWLSLVPYSQSVNVFDPEDPSRIQRWSRPGALVPVELRSLFRSGKASSLADPRVPDRAADLLCMYRGLGSGENFNWDQPPAGSFGVYYRHDLPENGSPGAPPISWVGPNPMFGQANGTEDTRWMVADKGCPNAALLPLSNDIDEIDARLNEMSTRFNVNYAIAMSWAAATLSPQMRGANGWGDNRLPLDFDDDRSDSNTKVIVMLANTTGSWFDTDSYNSEIGQAVGDDETGTDGSRNFARQRFIDLCRSFRDRNLKFHFIGVRPGDPEDFGRMLFDQQAGPGLQVCAGNDGSLRFADAASFAEGEDQIENLLERIIEDIKLNSYVRLVE